MPGDAEIQIKQWLKGIDDAVNKFDRKDKLAVLRKGAAIVRQSARSLTPARGAKASKSRIGAKLNPRYKYKGKGAKRSKRGEGVIVAKYAVGNLQKSIQTLTFRRSDSVYVGPKFGKKITGIVGSTVAKSDGYYARMVFGGDKAFRDRVLIPARDQNANQVFQIIAAEALQKIPQYFLKR